MRSALISVMTYVSRLHIGIGVEYCIVSENKVEDKIVKFVSKLLAKGQGHPRTVGFIT